MQKMLCFCVFTLLTTWVNAQDKIITVEKDTIECRIVSIGAEQIGYEQKEAGGYLLGKFIPIGRVETYFRLPQSPSNTFFRTPERPWLFRVTSGVSWMPWFFDDMEDEPGDGEDMEKLERGFHVNFSGHYLVSPNIGVGLQYSFFRSSADSEHQLMDYYSYLPYSPYSTFTEEDRHYVNYIGPSLIFRQFLGKSKKFQLSETLSGGILFYRAESQVSALCLGSSGYKMYADNVLLTGHTFGATVGLSAEYYLLPSLSAGLGANFIFGRLKEVDGKQKASNGGRYDVEGIELEKSLKISRLDYYLSVSVHF